jgi:hypothetical protein
MRGRLLLLLTEEGEIVPLDYRDGEEVEMR